MVNNNTNHTIKCDLCQREFPLTRDVLKEEQVTLYKDGLKPHQVTMTILQCPICGKHYPVIMDDETTLPLLEKLRAIMVKELKQKQKGFAIKPELERKRKELNRKLDFRRHTLAEKYIKSVYQLEDGTKEQLEYRYRAR